MLGARWPRGRREWFVVLWVGVVLFGGDYGLIYWAETSLDSGLTSILFATLPIFTIAFAHGYVPGDRMTLRKVAGTTVAFLGVISLFAERVRIDASQSAPMAAVIGAAVCAAAAAVVSKRHGGGMPSATINGPAMLVGAVALLLAAVATGEHVALPRGAAAWGAVAYLAVVGSVISFLGYFSLLKRWSVTSLSFIGVFIPLIAVVLGATLAGERVTMATISGGGLILAGVTIALTRRRRS